MADGAQHPWQIMEHQTGDHLSAVLASWRRELAAQASLTAEVRRELEAHLQDCLAGFRQRGLSGPEAFRLARRRMGELPQVDEEFKKVMNRTSHGGRPLAVAAWAVFVVSFFLPAYGTLHGWQCALLQNLCWPNVLRGDGMAIHYQFLTLANLLMLFSPLWLAQFSQRVRPLKWLHHATLAALLLVWAFVLQLVARQEGAGLRMGCYIWSGSFVLLYLAVRAQLAPRLQRKRAEPAGWPAEIL